MNYQWKDFMGSMRLTRLAYPFMSFWICAASISSLNFPNSTCFITPFASSISLLPCCAVPDLSLFRHFGQLPLSHFFILL
uniref:Uncharacterized protein MANES_04G118100 n=1 Tax=Rhizophora mucronata TaxID=61149 RepID=A0A2P2JG26_RHIMU